MLKEELSAGVLKEELSAGGYARNLWCGSEDREREVKTEVREPGSTYKPSARLGRKLATSNPKPRWRGIDYLAGDYLRLSSRRGASTFQLF